MAIPVDGVILKEEDLNRMFPPEETVVLSTNLDLLMISIMQKAALVAHELGIKPEEVTFLQLQEWGKSHQS